MHRQCSGGRIGPMGLGFNLLKTTIPVSRFMKSRWNCNLGEGVAKRLDFSFQLHLSCLTSRQQSLFCGFPRHISILHLGFGFTRVIQVADKTDLTCLWRFYHRKRWYRWQNGNIRWWWPIWYPSSIRQDSFCYHSQGSVHVHKLWTWVSYYLAYHVE